MDEAACRWRKAMEKPGRAFARTVGRMLLEHLVLQLVGLNTVFHNFVHNPGQVVLTLSAKVFLPLCHNSEDSPRLVPPTLRFEKHSSQLWRIGSAFEKKAFEGPDSCAK